MAAARVYRQMLRELRAIGLDGLMKKDIKTIFYANSSSAATRSGESNVPMTRHQKRVIGDSKDTGTGNFAGYQLAIDYSRMVGALHGYRALLEEHGIAIERADDSSQAQRRAIAETAKRVGLKVPQYEDEEPENFSE